MALYVCFNDSLNDPTYTSLDNAFIVDGPSNSDDNPCNHFQHLNHAPVCPINAQEAGVFAQLMGWERIVENGKVSFRTGIKVSRDRNATMKTREITNKLIEMMGEGVLDPRELAMMCMSYMSETAVADMARLNDLIEKDEEDEEDEEDEVDEEG